MLLYTGDPHHEFNPSHRQYTVKKPCSPCLQARKTRPSYNAPISQSSKTNKSAVYIYISPIRHRQRPKPVDSHGHHRPSASPGAAASTRATYSTASSWLANPAFPAPKAPQETRLTANPIARRTLLRASRASPGRYEGVPLDLSVSAKHRTTRSEA